MTDADRRALAEMSDRDCWEALSAVFEEMGRPLPAFMLAAAPTADLMRHSRALCSEFGAGPEMADLFERAIRYVKASAAAAN